MYAAYFSTAVRVRIRPCTGTYASSVLLVRVSVTRSGIIPVQLNMRTYDIIVKIYYRYHMIRVSYHTYGFCPHCWSGLLCRRPSATSSEAANKTAASKRIACGIGICIVLATVFFLLVVAGFVIVATHLVFALPPCSIEIVASLLAPAMTMVVGIRMRSDVVVGSPAVGVSSEARRVSCGDVSYTYQSDC